MQKVRSKTHVHVRRSPVLFWFIFLLCFLKKAAASDFPLKLSQYAHTAWRLSDGALPSAPVDVAQTPDGYLWIGTSEGLLRFDGVRFVAWDVQMAS